MSSRKRNLIGAAVAIAIIGVGTLVAKPAGMSCGYAGCEATGGMDHIYLWAAGAVLVGTFFWPGISRWLRKMTEDPETREGPPPAG